MCLWVKLSGRGIQSDIRLISSLQWGWTDTREVGNSMKLSYLFCHLLPEFQSRTWHALDVGDNYYSVDKTSVTPHLLRSYQHTFCLHLKSIVFSLWLYNKHNAKAAFQETCTHPKTKVLPTSMRRNNFYHVTLWAKGFYCNIWSWASKTTRRAYDLLRKLGR